MSGTSMTPKERYMAAFRHEEPDRVPVYINVRQLAFFTEKIRWYTQFERAKVLEPLGVDPIIDIWLPYPVPDKSVEIHTTRRRVHGDKCPLITKEYRTPAGVMRQVVRETEEWCDGMHTAWIASTLGSDAYEGYGMALLDDWCISRRLEPWVKDRADLAKLRYLMRVPTGYELDEWRHDALRAKEFAEANGYPTMVRRTITGDAFQWFCDIEGFAIKMIEEPEFCQELMDIWQEWSIEMTKLVLDIGVDVVQRRGWYETPDFWGPKYFRKYLMEGINEESRLVHDGGALHCYLLPLGHSEFVDVFKEMELDIHFGVDPVMGRCDLAQLKRELGGRQAMMGGVNAEVTLTQRTPEDVREATRQAIAILAPGGGFALAPVAGVWPAVPWTNVEALLEAAWEFGKYPITV